MASQPYINNDHLEVFYEKHKPQPLANQFYLLDLGGLALTKGVYSDIQNKNIIATVTSQTKPVLFQNYTLDGVAVTNTFGNYEVRCAHDSSGNIVQVYLWKTNDGTLLLRRINDTTERIVYYPRLVAFESVFASYNGITTNAQYSFKSGAATQYDYYHNGTRITAPSGGSIDEFFYKVLKIDIVMNSDGRWAKCQTSYTNAARLEWEDFRNGWTNNSAGYTVYIH